MVVAEAIERTRQEVEGCITTCQFKRALKSVMDLAQFGNQFFDKCAPWALLKSDRAKCGAVLNLNLQMVKALSILSYSYLPRSATGAWGYLGMSDGIELRGLKWLDEDLPFGQRLVEPRPLFSKMVIEEASGRFKGFEQVNLKIGKVLEVSPHPNAEKLLVLKVDIGKEIQLVAGLKAYYPGEELKGKMIVVITNLQPVKLRGVESQGMLLAAEANGKVKVLIPAGEAMPGEAVNSGLTQGSKEISLTDFQKVIIRVGSLRAKEVAIGRTLKVELPQNLMTSDRIAVFLPSHDATEALPLYTQKGVAITVDGGEIDDGAQVR
jgi:methionyl-tRNA synthetase